MTPEGGPEARPGTSGSAAPTASADFVVVANRLPIDMVRLPDGTTEWKRSPGGLVTALEPLLRRRRGAWIGWPGVPQDPDPDPDPDPEDCDPAVPIMTKTLPPKIRSSRTGCTSSRYG